MKASRVLHKTLLASLTIVLVGCVATDTSVLAPQNIKKTGPAVAPVSVPASSMHLTTTQTMDFIKSSDDKIITTPSNPITLEKIMSHPDWLGRQPEQAGWIVGQDIVRFARKREGSPVRDFFTISPTQPKINGELASLEMQHVLTSADIFTSPDQQFLAWLYEGQLLVMEQSTQVVKQITFAHQRTSNLRFLASGEISYQVENAIYATAPDTLATRLLFSWQFAKPPVPVKPAADYIAAEQIKLIQYIANKRQDRAIVAENKQQLIAKNDFTSTTAFYFAPDARLAAMSISPDGKWAIAATTPKTQWRDKTDIMPHYIQEDGRIASKEVRRRVADAKPRNDDLFLLDLTTQVKHPLSYSVLPGFNDDVLASVKEENAKRRGETYTVNRLPRDITLFSSWYWNEPPIYWHDTAGEVGIMLEAWDNKDRWIVTVDLAQKKLVPQHRLSDPAWINYAFNRFGWLPNSPALYYLSEETGYSHLYVKPVNSEAYPLTEGKYEVDQIVVSPDGQHIFYKANKKHPGIYEIYKVSVDGQEHLALTDLHGMTDFVLSPSGQHLLLTHSTMTRPPELFLTSSARLEKPIQLTQTVSEEFLALNFAAPSIVEIPSSHVAEPIYSRLYMNAQALEGEPKPAVIFNHGAGYLQNSHMGWSGYFREYMFHNYLVQQGYVVLDMDYRASKGYGRDWRTAIYRQMGTPETQDLVDGVAWLTQNANVAVDKVGTYGGSYGGFMTFMALFTEPELFQAGAALRPVSDWAHYNTPYTSNILNTPDVDPIAYERSSPIYFAEGLQKPLLMNAPMVDDNVFFVDVVRLVQRLIELEKEDFETAIYPVEPHGFVQPSSWLDEYRRIFKLFETHVK